MDARSASVGEIKELGELVVIRGEGDEGERVYVAVGKVVKESKSTLLWALRNISKEKKIVLVHVHRQALFVPMLEGKIPVSQLKEQQVQTYRQLEREKADKVLDDYLLMCKQLKVQAEKLVIQMDDVGRGLVELILQHGITNLVMGAAADKHYSKEMKVPKSKTAISVKEHADLSCKIWFVCKGNLICTREASLDGSVMAKFPTTSSLSSRSNSTLLGQLLSKSLGESLNSHASSMQEPFSHRTLIPGSRLTTERGINDHWEGISRSSQSSDFLLWLACDKVLSNSGASSIPRDEESEGLLILQQELEDLGLDADVYDKLQQALTEAGNSKREFYEESYWCRKAERDAIEKQRAKASVLLYIKEATQKREIEERLERTNLELEGFRSQQNEILKQLDKANERNKALEIQIKNSDHIIKELEVKLMDADHIIKDLDEKLSVAQDLLSSLQTEHEQLQQERDDAVRQAEELHQKHEQEIVCGPRAMNISCFSYSELQQATLGFDISLKIGESGYGSVYKGLLRHTPVVIKMLNTESMQVLSEFHQEVELLCSVRHPNLVHLLGACPEAWALIYEFLPGGNLEDRLECKNNTQPLAWQTRTRIAAEICSALIFLHSNKPHPIVHGNLKPENILLDANYVSKLGDFVIWRLFNQYDTTTTTHYRHAHPKGTFVYMDPEFLATGKLTPYSDVYSFGIIILRLLTGRPAVGIVKEVQMALEKGYFHNMIDPLAGEWSFVQAMQLAHLGLRCCDLSCRNRPDLVLEAWRVLEPMTKAASFSASQLTCRSVLEDNSRVPPYFICPIFQEIMSDPHIAADGFTYEAEALRSWLGDHSTSPMTNLRLPNKNLIPNRALHSAIQDWLERQK